MWNVPTHEEEPWEPDRRRLGDHRANAIWERRRRQLSQPRGHAGPWTSSGTRVLDIGTPPGRHRGNRPRARDPDDPAGGAARAPRIECRLDGALNGPVSALWGRRRRLSQRAGNRAPFSTCLHNMHYRALAQVPQPTLEGISRRSSAARTSRAAGPRASGRRGSRVAPACPRGAGPLRTLWVRREARSSRSGGSHRRRDGTR
jgi:hypothetical protein